MEILVGTETNVDRVKVIDNTNIKVLFRVNDNDTAESFSKQLGTFTTLKETERIDKSLMTKSEGFSGSVREVEEFIISPNKLKRELKRGQALIFGKHPKIFYELINTDYIEDPKRILQIEYNNKVIKNSEVKNQMIKLVLMEIILYLIPMNI